MTKPVQDWPRDDVPGELHRLLLVDGLMRAGGVVEADKLGDQLSQVRLVEDEHMVEQLTSERSDEALRDWESTVRSARRARRDPRRPG